MADDQQTYTFVMVTLAKLASDFTQVADLQQKMANQAARQPVPKEIAISMQANAVRLRKAAAICTETIAIWRRHNPRDAQRAEAPRNSPSAETKADISANRREQ